MFFSGIAPVQFLAFTPLGCIRWEEPVFVSHDVDGVEYNVYIFSGGDHLLLPPPITTSETQDCPELTLCQEYTVTVTPFSTSPDYIGDNTTVTNTTPGGICGLRVHNLIKQGWC